jgi:hypothetical protein
LAAFRGVRASTHTAMVFTTTVGQCLGLAGVASTSSVGSAGLFTPHLIAPHHCLCRWLTPQLGVVESEVCRAIPPRPRASSARHLNDTRSEKA